MTLHAIVLVVPLLIPPALPPKTSLGCWHGKRVCNIEIAKDLAREPHAENNPAVSSPLLSDNHENCTSEVPRQRD